MYITICTYVYIYIHYYVYIYRYVRHIFYVQWYTSTTVACDSTIHAAQRLFLFLFELPLEARLHCLSPCQIEKNTRRRRRNMLSFRKALRLEPCKKMICKYLLSFFSRDIIRNSVWNIWNHKVVFTPFVTACGERPHLPMSPKSRQW